MLLKLFHKIESEKKCYPAHSMKSILVPRPYKDKTEKEKYRSTSLMNVDIKFANKRLSNQIQQYI
jgi:hypothetical protein